MGTVVCVLLDGGTQLGKSPPVQSKGEFHQGVQRNYQGSGWIWPENICGLSHRQKQDEEGQGAWGAKGQKWRRNVGNGNKTPPNLVKSFWFSLKGSGEEKTLCSHVSLVVVCSSRPQESSTGPYPALACSVWLTAQPKHICELLHAPRRHSRLSQPHLHNPKDTCPTVEWGTIIDYAEEEFCRTCSMQIPELITEQHTSIPLLIANRECVWPIWILSKTIFLFKVSRSTY